MIVALEAFFLRPSLLCALLDFEMVEFVAEEMEEALNKTSCSSVYQQGGPAVCMMPECFDNQPFLKHLRDQSEATSWAHIEDDCEIFLLKAAEPSLPTFASTAVCQDTAKATGTGGLHPAADLPTDASLQGSSLYTSIPGTGGLHPAADLPTDASLQGSSLYSSIPDPTPADGVNIILTNAEEKSRNGSLVWAPGLLQMFQDRVDDSDYDIHHASDGIGSKLLGILEGACSL
ncbi:hypothetical protein ACOMHN_014230 [Nucella lapillus]